MTENQSILTILSKSSHSDLLPSLKALDSFNSLVKAIEAGHNITNLPILPLYNLTNTLSTDELGLLLPVLTKAQRQALFDLDLWQKDQFNIKNFYTWLGAFTQIKNNDELKIEFVKSSEFLLFLKLHFTISTFDIDDPEYPEHENFFITDDQLLLFEFPENFPFIDDIQNLVRLYYASNDVEFAYANLFKMVAESHMLFEEKEYQKQSKRVQELGLMTYYDSLKITNPFQSISQVNKFIESKKMILSSSNISYTDEDEDFDDEEDYLDTKLPTIYNKIAPLSSFKNTNLLPEIKNETTKISTAKLHDQILANFFDLMNAHLIQKGLLKESSNFINNHFNDILFLCNFAVKYIKSKFSQKDPIFNFFTFSELYQIGFSLLNIPKKRLVKGLQTNGFSGQEKKEFLGDFNHNFLDECSSFLPKFKGKMIEDVETYENWNLEISFFLEILPYINKIEETFSSLKKNEVINDIYYLNYNLETITFENIAISLAINYFLYNNPLEKKIGVTPSDLIKFINDSFIFEDDKHKIKPLNELTHTLNNFCINFGFGELKNSKFEEYLYNLFDFYLSNLDYNHLENTDFEHIGGAILLATFSPQNGDQKDYLHF